jgi:hypothetical protein
MFGAEVMRFGVLFKPLDLDLGQKTGRDSHEEVRYGNYR